MPNCRNCGARLSKFDKDICPVCGTKNPLEGVSSETVEITSQVDLSGFAAGQKVMRHRKSMLLLSCLIGFTGAMFFYLKNKKFGILWFLINLGSIAGITILLFTLPHLHIALSLVIGFIFSYICNVILGLLYFFKPNLKDAEGEFVV